MLRALPLAVLLLAGCREQGLAGLEERWRVEPESLRLPNAAALGFDCPLPGVSYEGGATHGLWIAQVGSSITAFQVPGAETSVLGWSTFRGNPWNEHRPR